MVEELGGAVLDGGDILLTEEFGHLIRQLLQLRQDIRLRSVRHRAQLLGEMERQQVDDGKLR